jgi:O-acetyl-ADP-ribose deacetylase (regulator of RNase III)
MPSVQDGKEARRERKENCATVNNCLKAAKSRNAKSIAFPALFGYPLKHATRVIVEAIKDCDASSSFDEIMLVDMRKEAAASFWSAVSDKFKGKQSQSEGVSSSKYFVLSFFLYSYFLLQLPQQRRLLT